LPQSRLGIEGLGFDKITPIFESFAEVRSGLNMLFQFIDSYLFEFKARLVTNVNQALISSDFAFESDFLPGP
jgi:hypothetical protein